MSCFGKLFNNKKHRITTNFDDPISLTTIPLSDWVRLVIDEFTKLENMKMIDLFCKEQLINLVTDIYNNYYSHIPFHNQNHAFEVFQFGICLLQRHRNMLWDVDNKDMLTFTFALLLHDIGHRGYINSYWNDETLLDLHESEIAYTSDSSDSSYASSYNERTHINIGCKLLETHDIIFNKYLFNKLIYTTDLEHHNSFLLKYNPFYGNQIRNSIDNIQITNLFKLFIKLADIGHILRPWQIHLNNVVKLNKERTKQLSSKDLVADTLYFNNSFVLPLLQKFKLVNIGLYFKLHTRYMDNIRRWEIINEFSKFTN